MGICFKLFVVPASNKLLDGAYELAAGDAEKLTKSVQVLSLTSASAAVFSETKMDDGGSPHIQSS